MAENTSNLLDASFLGLGRVPESKSEGTRFSWLSGEYCKPLLDCTIAGLLLVVLLPIMVVIAVLVSLDGGPIFYGHKRVGRNGHEFRCFKFRSMAVDADRILADLLTSDARAAAEWESTRKLRHDPRVTLLGKVLRSTSLDEIPQLFNVLRREMSLVGPRPIVNDEVRFYSEKIKFYYDVRPGITGLWQTSGRSNASYEERVRLDTWYVENRSTRLDLKILLNTVPAVLQRRGAH